jgi:anti-sigma B factor antagonist
VNLPAAILVGVTGRVVHVKVQGKGSFQTSPAFKEFAKEMFDRGFREFSVDLADCAVMDSTFMGTLAGVALRLREVGGALVVKNANRRNFDLLRNLGLHNVFDVRTNAEEANSTDDPLHSALEIEGSLNRSEHAACIIEAHEALVDADPENLARFKDVLDYLKQDLRVGATASK